MSVCIVLFLLRTFLGLNGDSSTCNKSQNNMKQNHYNYLFIIKITGLYYMHNMKNIS